MDNSVTVTNTGGNTWTCVLETHNNDADGTLDFTVNYLDTAGNPGSAVTTTTDSSAVTIDNTHPTVTFTSTDVSTAGRHNGAISVTATFSEAMTGVAEGEFSGSNCVISNYNAASSTSYTFTCTPSSDGATVTLNYALNQATDPAGNGNTCLLYTSPSPRDLSTSRMPSSA